MSIGRKIDHKIFNFFLGFMISSCIAMLFLVIAPEEFTHWFVLPLLACGALSSIDLIDWLAGRTNALDLSGIVGALCFFSCFLAPLLHVYWDYWMLYVRPPDDWRYWLGLMAILNSVGLLAYHVVKWPQARRGVTFTYTWRLKQIQFYSIISIILILAAGSQIWIYITTGGISEFADTARSRALTFSGLGPAFLLGQTFPILLITAYAARLLQREGRKITFGLVKIILFGIILVCVLLLCGGLTGSRSSVVAGLFMAVGLYHYLIKPLGRKVLVLGGALLVCFMFVFSYYKSFGLQAVDLMDDPFARSKDVRYGGLPLKGILLSDLSRSDVQAMVLSRVVRGNLGYKYKFGMTYIGAIALVIPRSVWPDRPASKLKAGTEALYGEGAYISNEYYATYVYGLAGEALLNFGPVAVPFMFALLGWIVNTINRASHFLPSGDARLLFLPCAIWFTMNMLTGDSDNLFVLALRMLVIPGVAIFMGSKRVSYAESA